MQKKKERRKEKREKKTLNSIFLNIDFIVQIFRVNKNTRDKNGHMKK